jgi:hypothetical protein
VQTLESRDDSDSHGEQYYDLDELLVHLFAASSRA